MHREFAVERAAAAAAQRPEDLIDERVNFWDHTRFCREWKHGFTPASA